MNKTIIAAISLTIALGMTACSKSTYNVEVISGAEESATTEQSSVENVESDTEKQLQDSSNDNEEVKEAVDEIVEEIDNSESDSQERINDDQALAAIRNYCLISNPELEDMVNSEDYTTYWEIESSDDGQIVVLYRSYTGALVRYYIDAATGDTYVTEFVQGITDTEERTDETFNVKDYYE